MGSIFFQLDPAAEKEHIKKKKNEADMKREAEVEKKSQQLFRPWFQFFP